MINDLLEDTEFEQGTSCHEDRWLANGNQSTHFHETVGCNTWYANLVIASSGFCRAATSLVAASSKVTRSFSGRVPLTAAVVTDSMIECAISIFDDEDPPAKRKIDNLCILHLGSRSIWHYWRVNRSFRRFMPSSMSKGLCWWSAASSSSC